MGLLLPIARAWALVDFLAVALGASYSSLPFPYCSAARVRGQDDGVVLLFRASMLGRQMPGAAFSDEGFALDDDDGLTYNADPIHRLSQPPALIASMDPLPLRTRSDTGHVAALTHSRCCVQGLRCCESMPNNMTVPLRPRGTVHVESVPVLPASTTVNTVPVPVRLVPEIIPIVSPSEDIPRSGQPVPIPPTTDCEQRARASRAAELDRVDAAFQQGTVAWSRSVAQGTKAAVEAASQAGHALEKLRVFQGQANHLANSARNLTAYARVDGFLAGVARLRAAALKRKAEASARDAMRIKAEAVADRELAENARAAFEKAERRSSKARRKIDQISAKATEDIRIAVGRALHTATQASQKETENLRRAAIKSEKLKGNRKSPPLQLPCARSSWNCTLGVDPKLNRGPMK